MATNTNAHVLAAIVLVLALAASCATAQNVVELASGNFTTTVATGTSMVLFYSPWCPHCKRAAPAYRNFARKTKALRKDHPGFTIAQINCEANEETCDTHAIEGYPTFLIFQEGKALFEYDGETDSDSLTTFVTDAAKKGWKFTPHAAAAPPDAAAPVHEDL
ncbi:thioredoxin-like protein [Blastocladiella britannica]|nr:thioredoxin-like protein [Blastocladiella britannica]